MADLKLKYRLCHKCGAQAESIACRALTQEDLPALGTGPVCYAHMLLCEACGRAWIVLAAESGAWYGIGGND